MEDIKVGEYIRTKIGHIGKVVYIRKPLEGLKNDRIAYLINWDNGKAYYISQVKDVNHSFNIIDLIKKRRLCEWERSCDNLWL